MNNNKYLEIIDLPHYEPKYHPRMSIMQRSAQFAPFSALTGYDDLVEETSRITDKKKSLSEYEQNILNEKLSILQKNIKNKPNVTFTYFVKDEKKSGGKYIKITSSIKSIDLVNRFIKLTNNQIIKIENIYNIESDIFKN